MSHEQQEREFEQQTDEAEKKGEAVDAWIESVWHDQDYDLAPQFLAAVFASQDGAEYVDFMLKRDISSVNKLMVMFHDYKEFELKRQAREALGYD